MKKLLLNIVIGFVISIATLGVTTLWLGTMYTYNGFSELMIEELFSNVEIKVLLVGLGGIIFGTFNYIGFKYKNNVLFSIASGILLAILIIFMMNFTNYSILFKVMYFAVSGLAICMGITINELLSTKNDEKNKNVETKEN